MTLDRFTADDSTVLSVTDWQAQTGQDAHSIVREASAVFVDMANNDYRVSETSAARDIGTSLNAPVIDHDGNARPSGAAVDVGAFEYCGGSCSPGLPGSAGSSGNSGGDGGRPSTGGATAGLGAGSAAGDNSVGGSPSGSAGSSGIFGGLTGGTNASAGDALGADQSGAAAGDEGGCACKMSRRRSESGWAIVAALALVALGRRRRSGDCDADAGS